MTSVSHVTAMYATKRRRRNSKNVRTVCSKDSHSKSNPSKRHRERLNQELDTLASLLPFEQSVLSKLDKLSILRLSVSYLRTKSYFQAALSSQRVLSSQQRAQQHYHQKQEQQLFGQAAGQQLEPPMAASQQQPQRLYPAELRIEGDLIVQALNGFLLILTCDGEVFYTSHTVETYLGFHQSDICHQSVYELVHSEDREELMQQLKWNSLIPQHQAGLSGQATSNTSTPCSVAAAAAAAAAASAGATSAGAPLANNPLLEQNQAAGLSTSAESQQKSATQMSLQEILASTDHRHLLERNFTVRFRCLLDNTSGFLDFIALLLSHGQSRENKHTISAKSLERPANNAVCAPFVPSDQPSLGLGYDHSIRSLAAECGIHFESRLDIRGRIKVLHGQQNQHNLANSAATNKKQQQQQQFDGNYSQREPLLAFFGVCIPFGPPSLLEMPSKDSVFKSKHRLDMSIISMDSRGKQMLGLNDLSSIFKTQNSGSSPSSRCASPALIKTSSSLVSGGTQVKLESSNSSKSNHTNATKQSQNISAYDLVHHDDLSYMASAHQELLKTGASGLIAYRMINQTDGKHQWLQTSAKLYYKNSKPDFILCTHRPLMEEEGRDLLGKRTMDFKVTYLDVGLSSINDRILACDKFSSLQALGNSSSARHGSVKSPPGATVSSHQLGANGGHFEGSPTLSGESSRSIASLSPQSANNEEVQARGTKAKRKFNYDLNSNHQNQQYLDDYESQESALKQQQPVSFNTLSSATYDTHYQRPQNGDVFYDMDSSVPATIAPSEESLGVKGNKKKVTKTSSKQAVKKRDLLLAADGQPNEKLLALDNKATKRSSVQKDQMSLSEVQLQQQVAVDQHLHLYNHYNHHLQSAEADSYPAIQAAAVYAASLGHTHSAGVVGGAHHQAAYSGSVNHIGYNHHNHPASQSIYGTASIVSPSAYSQHQHRSHLHHLDATAYQPSAHYGTFSTPTNHQQGAQTGYGVASSGAVAAAAAASSFLPTEHLLHHYSQSAARSAALAAWPATSSAPQALTCSSVVASANDYNHRHDHSNHNSRSSNYATAANTNGSGWGASAAAAAAAALVASANGGADASTSKREPDSYSPNNDLYGQRNVDQQYHQQQRQHHLHQQHHQQSQQQTTLASIGTESTSPNGNKSSLSAVAAAVVAQRYTNLGVHQHQKVHGPASLASDGSIAHRSPLSSSESSNGSGSLAAAHAVAAATAMAASTDSSAMISPSAYYLGEHSQQHQQQHQHHSHHQPQSYSAHQNQQLAAYHQSPYATTHQYGADAAVHFNQNPYQQQQHHHHHQSVGSDQHATYFQHGGDLSVAADQASNHSAASTAMKLYGANGCSSNNDGYEQTNLDSFETSCRKSNDYILEGDELCDWTSSNCQHSNGDQPEYESLTNKKIGFGNCWRDDQYDSPQAKLFHDSVGGGITELEDTDSSQESGRREDEEMEDRIGEVDSIDENQRDPLAQLISSTIGDIMLDIAPTN